MQFGQHWQNMRIHKGSQRMQLCTTHICHCWEILDGDKAERVSTAQLRGLMTRWLQWSDTKTQGQSWPTQMIAICQAICQPDWCIRILIRRIMIVMTDQVTGVMWVTPGHCSDHPRVTWWLWCDQGPGSSSSEATTQGKVRINSNCPSIRWRPTISYQVTWTYNTI